MAKKPKPIDPATLTPEVMAKFDARWTLGAGVDACWEWTAGTNEMGYGLMRAAGDRLLAHRISYTYWRGQIPDGLSLDHLCRNRRCVNPAHLEATTHRTNILRGVGFTAQHARKDECIHGHPLSGDNLWIDSRGSRVCRECNRGRSRRHAQRRRAAARLRDGGSPPRQSGQLAIAENTIGAALARALGR